MAAVQRTRGPIIELGCGIYSTAYLHWACQPTKRKLATYESNPRYYDYARQFERDFHKVHCIENWDGVDLSEDWSVALVDHAPDQRRRQEVSRLTHVDFVVVHDTENRNERKYKFTSIFKLFKYRYKYNDAYPHTTVFSNKHDVSGGLL
jgi:predicted O-methyltransferase YrrM